MSKGGNKPPPFLAVKRRRSWNQSPVSTNANANDSGIVNSIKRFVGGFLSPSKPLNPTQDSSNIDTVNILFSPHQHFWKLFYLNTIILGDSIEQGTIQSKEEVTCD